MTTKFVVRPSLRRIRQRFRAAMKVARDDAGPYGQASIFVTRWVLKNFASQGGLIGGPAWRPFKAEGRPKKRGKKRFSTGRTVNKWELDRSAKLLQDTGLLRSSFHPFVDTSGKEKQAGVRSDLPYSEFHQEGIHGRLPQRRMLPEQEEVNEQVSKIFERWMKKVEKELTKRA